MPLVQQQLAQRGRLPEALGRDRQPRVPRLVRDTTEGLIITPEKSGHISSLRPVIDNPDSNGHPTIELQTMCTVGRITTLRSAQAAQFIASLISLRATSRV